MFAGVLMIMMGAYQAIGSVALFDDGYYAVRPDGLVVNVDYYAIAAHGGELRPRA